MKIDFYFDTPYGKFTDAIYLSDDHNLTHIEIEEMKQQRVDNWITIITTPPVQEVPSE